MRVVFGALLGLAAATLLHHLAFSPWPLLALVFVLCVAAVGQFTSWAFAAGASTIILVAAAAIAARCTADIPLPFSVDIDVVLGTVGLAAAAVLATRPQPRSVSRPTLLRLLPATAVAIVCAAAVTLSAAVGRLGLSWAMQNDAVWNMVTARWIVQDGGIDPAAHPNASPMAPLAIAVAIGDGTVGNLQHDVARAGELLIIVALCASVLAGTIAMSMGRHARPALTVLGAVVAAIVPVSWFTLGNSLDLGFYNAAIALPLLLASWLCWFESRARPLAGVAILALGSVATLATWGPLVVVPGSLLILSAAEAIRRRQSWTRGGAVVAGVAVLILIGYALLVTVPDVTGQAGALAADGGIIALQARWAGALIAIGVVVVSGYAAAARSPRVAIGLGVLLAGSAAGVALLVFQRRHQPVLWGYYPIKFSWLVASAVIIVAASALSGAVVRLRLKAAIPVVGVGIVAIGTALWQLPPDRPGPPNAFPVASIALGASGVGSVSHFDDAARQLFAIAGPTDGGTRLASRYAGLRNDQFMNLWLLQLAATTTADPTRHWAYSLHPDNDKQVCQAIQDAHGSVTVVTRDAAATAGLSRSCLAAFRVQVVEPR